MLEPIDLRFEYQCHPEKFVSRKEAAALLGYGVASISRYIQEGRLEALRVGKRRLLVYKPSLWELLDRP